MVSLMTRQCPPDGAFINLVSHWDVPLISGRPISQTIVEPFEFELDLDNDGQRLPTFFTTPAFVATETFCRHLREAGVDNLQEYRATIANPETGETFDHYRVLNIVGLVACADAAASDVSKLGPDLHFYNEIIVSAAAVPRDIQIFRLAEDPTKIIVDDRLLAFLRTKGYTDIYAEPLAERA